MILLVTDKRLRPSEVRGPQSKEIGQDRECREGSVPAPSLFRDPRPCLHSWTAPLQGSLGSTGCHGLTEVFLHSSASKHQDPSPALENLAIYIPTPRYLNPS